MRQLIDAYNTIAKTVDKGFNYAGAAPFCIPIATSPFRAMVGGVQAVAGKVFAIIGVVGWGVAALTGSSYQVQRSFVILSLFGFEQIIHGVLNTIRAVAEFSLSAFSQPVFGIANLLLIPINQGMREPFAPVFAYGSLTGRSYEPMVSHVYTY